MGEGSGYSRCQKCNYNLCWGWAETNNGNQIIACSRCGLDVRRFAKHDIKRGKQSYTEAVKLIQSGNIIDAMKVLNMEWLQESQLSNEVKKEKIEETLNWMRGNGFKRFYLKDKAGKLVYYKKIDDVCIGDYWYSRKEGVKRTDIGAPKNLQDFKERWVPEVKNHLSEAEFTEKRGNTWFAISLITRREREIRDDEEEPH